MVWFKFGGRFGFNLVDYVHYRIVKNVDDDVPRLAKVVVGVKEE
jgi:hypothetical protein